MLRPQAIYYTAKQDSKHKHTSNSPLNTQPFQTTAQELVGRYPMNICKLEQGKKKNQIIFLQTVMILLKLSNLEGQF